MNTYEELFFSYADYAIWNQTAWITLGEFVYVSHGYEPFSIRLHDIELSEIDLAGYEHVFVDFCSRKLENFKLSWKKIALLGRELLAQSNAHTKVRYSNRQVPYYEASFLVQWAKSKNIKSHPSYFPVQLNETTSKNFSQPSNNITEIPKQKRLHDLREQIKSVFITNPEITNEQMWSHLIDLSENSDSAIQEVTSFRANNANIFWVSHNDNEQQMSKKTFMNHMSNLRNPKLNPV